MSTSSSASMHDGNARVAVNASTATGTAVFSTLPKDRPVNDTFRNVLGANGLPIDADEDLPGGGRREAHWIAHVWWRSKDRRGKPIRKANCLKECLLVEQRRRAGLL